MEKLVELTKGKKARFIYTDLNNLWYETDDGYKFPIPFDGIMGRIKYEEPATKFIRQIRKQLEKDE